MNYESTLRAIAARHKRRKRPPMEAHRNRGSSLDRLSRDPGINSRRRIIDSDMAKPPHYRDRLPRRA